MTDKLTVTINNVLKWLEEFISCNNDHMSHIRNIRTFTLASQNNICHHYTSFTKSTIGQTTYFFRYHIQNLIFCWILSRVIAMTSRRLSTHYVRCNNLLARKESNWSEFCVYTPSSALYLYSFVPSLTTKVSFVLSVQDETFTTLVWIHGYNFSLFRISFSDKITYS